MYGTYLVWNPNKAGDSYFELRKTELKEEGNISSCVTTSDITGLINAVYNETDVELRYMPLKDGKLPPLYVFDLDGTLRNSSGANHLAPRGKSTQEAWQPWQDEANKGEPLDNVAVGLYKALFDANERDHLVAIVTGSQYGTAAWLEANGLPIPDVLIERSGEYYIEGRSTRNYKLDVFEFLSTAFTVRLWVDDDQYIIQEIDIAGTPTIHIKPT